MNFHSLNIKELTDNLKSSTKPSNWHQTSALEAYFRTISNKPEYFLALLDIIRTDQQASIAAAIQINSLLRLKSNKANSIQRKQFAKLLYNTIVQKSIQLKIKKHLMFALQNLIYVDSTLQIQKAIKIKINQLIDSQNLQSACILIQALICSQVNQSAQIINLQDFSLLINKSLLFVLKNLEYYQKELKLILQTLRIISSKVFLSRSLQTIKILIFKTQILQYLKEIFLQKEEKVRFLINFQELKNLSISIIIQILFSLKQLKNLNQLQKVSIKQTLFPIFKSIYNYSISLPTYNNISQNIILLLSKLCGLQLMYNYVYQYSFSIVFQIILPRMKTNDQQLKMIFQNPQQFVNLSINVINNHNQISSNKSQLIKLLLVLTDNMHGLIFKVSLFLIQTLQNTFLDLPISQQFLHLNFNCLNKQAKIQISFTVLTVLSNKLVKRLDIIQKYQNFLLKISPYMLQNNFSNQLILLKFLNFFLFHSQHLFNNQYPYFIYFLRLLSNTQSKAIKILLVQLISNLFQQETLKRQYQKYVILTLNLLLNLITKDKQLFQMYQLINLLIKDFNQLISSQKLSQLLDIIIYQLNNQNIIVTNNIQNRSVRLHKLCHIIQQIFLHQSLILNNHQIIINKIQPLVLSLNPKKILFYDQIIKIVNLSISITKNINPLSIQLLTHLQLILIHQDYQLGLLYQFIILFIKYGKNYNQNNPNTSSLFISICLRTIKAGQAQFNNLIQGLLAMEMLTIYWVDSIYEQKLIQIACYCKNYYYNERLQYGQSSKIKPKVQCLFLLIINLKIDILYDQDYQKFFFDIINDNQIVYEQLDCKIYSFSLSQLLDSQFKTCIKIKLIRKALLYLCILKQPKLMLVRTQIQQQDFQSQHQDKTMNRLSSQLLLIDQFQFFRNSFQKLKLKPDWKQLLQLFVQRDFQCLNQVLKYRRIKIGNREIIRKIVKILK